MTSSIQLFKQACSTAAEELKQAAQEFPKTATTVAAEGFKTVSDWTNSAVEWASAHQKEIFTALFVAGIVALRL